MLVEFDMKLPGSLSEVLQTLSAHQSSVALIAGGTNLVVDLRAGKQSPALVVALDNIDELKGICIEEGFIRCGSLVTLNDVLASPVIQEHAPSLVAAAKTFASPLVRNRATLGGNLADASPAADSVPPLLTYDAEVETACVHKTRRIPLAEFFTGVRKTVLKKDEVITSVLWKIPDAGTRMAYYKLGLRKADAISVVSASVAIVYDSDKVVQKARIALGSVAPTPIRAYEAEKFLLGKHSSESNCEQAGILAADQCSPISDIRGSADYRKRMVQVLVKRLILQTLQNL